MATVSTIQSNTTATEIAGGIRESWNHPSKAGRIVVLVEGKADLCLYRNFMRGDKVEFGQMNGRCDLHKETFDLVRGYKIPVIGIRDSDFHRLNGTCETAEGYFYTDTHDREMDFFSHEDWLYEFALAKVESLNPNFDLLGYICDDLEVISKIKWYNSIHDVRYKFDGFSVMKFKSDEIRNFNTVHNSLSNQQSPDNGFREELKLSESSYNNFSQSASPCRLQLTNGHDFSERLRYHLYNSGHLLENTDSPIPFKKFSTKEEDFEVFLRLAYSFEKFQQTILYSEILQWQTLHGVSILRG